MKYGLSIDITCLDLKILFGLFSLHTRSSKDSTFILVDGDKYIYEDLCGFKFRISPDSFFQVNTLAAEVLYEELFKIMSPTKTSTLLDMCSGTGKSAIKKNTCNIDFHFIKNVILFFKGTVSIIGSQYVQSCVGIESVAQAVNDAKETAKINSIDNCDFVEGKVEMVKLVTIQR